ncbi:MAG: hypothetical protein ACLQMT_12620 [Candidatus Acidiferrales bacterium]
MTNIQKQMMATFLSLRVGVGVIGIVFPLLLWGGGKIAGIHLADSMSAYYHANRDCIDPKRPEPTAPCSVHPPPTGMGPMRNWFVGTLFVVGVCLYLIKGFSKWENIFLTIAGILAVCVAIFPMPWTDGEVTGFPKHYVSAVAFFILVAFVCVFCSDKTLNCMPNNIPNREKVIARYRRRYLVLAMSMVLSPVAAYAFNEFTRQNRLVFWAEAFGVWAFGIYWLVKTKELSLSDVERRALKGEVDMDISTLR